MDKPKEKVKLDQVLKFLFSTSNKVLINLLNGVFDESFNENEVNLTVTNNEFIGEDFNFEENSNIEDYLKLKIVFLNNEEYIYSVGVMKYWDFSDEELIKRKMYPLIPLQLFSLRKELEIAKKKNNIERIKELSYIAKDLATKLATESKELLDKNEILAEDFHKMLLAIQNLIEYLNRNYMNDERIEKEVNTMTETLYNPEVEKRGIEKGIEIGREEGIEKGIEIGREEGREAGREEVILELLKESFTPENIAKIIKIDLEKVLEIRGKYIN